MPLARLSLSTSLTQWCQWGHRDGIPSSQLLRLMSTPSSGIATMGTVQICQAPFRFRGFHASKCQTVKPPSSRQRRRYVLRHEFINSPIPAHLPPLAEPLMLSAGLHLPSHAGRHLTAVSGTLVISTARVPSTERFVLCIVDPNHG